MTTVCLCEAFRAALLAADFWLAEHPTSAMKLPLCRMVNGLVVEQSFGETSLAGLPFFARMHTPFDVLGHHQSYCQPR